MGVKEYYENHLGKFYSWMTGDFALQVRASESFFLDNGIKSLQQGLAIDLGCGHGIQSVALAHLGCKVVSVDFNKQLLSELAVNSENLPIQLVESEMITFLSNYKEEFPDIIVCMGDTLSHLDCLDSVKKLCKKCFNILKLNGKMIISYRDYSYELKGNDRFIPVKSDDNRILTCFIEYQDQFVTITDILYDKEKGKWIQRIGSYQKVRLTGNKIREIFNTVGFKTVVNTVINGMNYMIVEK